MAGGVSGYPTMAGSLGGQKRKGETPTEGGGWYKFYSKSYFCQTVPRASQAVLQLHPAHDLLHQGPILQGIHVPERRPTVHWVLLLGLM